MPTHSAPAVVNALLHVAREQILTVFKPDSCIASTRIAIDVLGYFGVPAKPVPVSVMILNAEARAILEEDGLDAVAAAVAGWGPQETGGPWTIGLGVIVPADKPTPGHVAVVMPSLNMMVDLSLDQASRERKNIFLGPVALEIPDEIPFLETPGKRVLYTVRLDETSSPVTLMYQHERQHRYRQSLNWQRKGSERAAEGFRQVTAAIITRMKEQLANQADSQSEK